MPFLSTATTWALFALTQAPEVQTKLREELLEFGNDHPSMDDVRVIIYILRVISILLYSSMLCHTSTPLYARLFGYIALYHHQCELQRRTT